MEDLVKKVLMEFDNIETLVAIVAFIFMWISSSLYKKHKDSIKGVGLFLFWLLFSVLSIVFIYTSFSILMHFSKVAMFITIGIIVLLVKIKSN